MGKLDTKIDIARVAGKLNKFNAQTLLNVDFQALNNFNVIFYPTSFSFTAIKDSVIDTALATLFVKNIQGLAFPELEYKDINGIKHVVGISAPEEVTMEFRETEIGAVRDFVQRWSDSIYTDTLPSNTPSLQFAGSTRFNTDEHSYYYVFNSNQIQSKKNAIIMIKGSMGLPSIGGWILLEGLKLKGASGMEFDQESEDIMDITVDMSVDMIKFVTPLSLI